LSLDPDPNSYDALVKMLQDEGWGFRWYAARRIRYIGNKSTVPIIEKRLKTEEHKDVRNELEKALKKLR
jgi:HEAT repeat protein